LADDARLHGGDRIVTFSNGSMLRERLVISMTMREGSCGRSRTRPTSIHNASAQVFADAAGRGRFVWIADFLPNEFADRAASLMEQALGVIKRTLETGQARR
jgi:hypothetical protein